MKKQIIAILSIAAGLALSGCGTAAHRTAGDTNKGITTVRGFNFKDYQLTAEEMINQLLASGRLPKAQEGKPPVIAVSPIRNSTQEHLDTQLLTQKITIALDKSGKATTTGAVSWGKGTVDPGVSGVRDLENEDMYDEATLQRERSVSAPNLALAGEITEIYTTQGRNRESYYQIYLTVTDLKTGVIVWQDAREVVKKDKRSLFGS